MIVQAGLLLCFAFVSWLLTGWARRYALANDIIDNPNHRSSHSTPTPRGGGVSIAAVSLGGLTSYWGLGLLEWHLPVAMVGGGALIAAVGWWDDHHELSALVRAAAHFGAAGWAVYWLGGVPILQFGELQLGLGGAGGALAVVGLVWLTNLYNFMDGIDGLAGIEAVSVGGIGGILLLSVGETGLAAVAFLITAASTGFLVWNWPPAKIFMGDVGSGLLGFLFGCLAIASERIAAVPLVLWLLLLGAFIVDATVTLFRRALRGEIWYSAHRSHAYQRAVQFGWSHARVTGAVLLINLFLGLLAWAALINGTLVAPASLGALLVLVSAYMLLEALEPMS